MSVASYRAEVVPARYRSQVIRHRVRFFPERILALTFDDGPTPDLTPRVLNILASYRARGTFFVLGRQAERHPEMLRRIISGGHAIGSHGYAHAARLPTRQALEELIRTEQAVRAATGVPPSCFRPPYGITANSLTRLAQRRGYAVILWTISSADTRPIGPYGIANNVIHTPNPGDIVLMHDGPGHRATVEALPRILGALSREGWRFVTVPELLRRWDQRIGAHRP